ncbi:MAG: hypothetical protein EP330_27985 [Deltaproteobacteria bacterium]|nr:MAG: hypothetical protein EP330_27985 [Deltaproteobacteria bacterium]
MMRGMGLCALLAAMSAGCAKPEEAPDHWLRLQQGSLVDERGDLLDLSVHIERTDGGEPCNFAQDPWCDVDPYQATPILAGPNGELLEAPAYTDRGGNFVDFMVPLDAAYGRWQVVGFAGIDLPLRDVVDFEVRDWGAATTFDPQTIDGVWEVHDWETRPMDVKDILDPPPVFAEIVPVDAEHSELRLIAESDGGPCVLLQTTGTWQGSALVYEEERVVVEDPGLGEIAAENARIVIAWSTSSDLEARGTVDGSVDTFALDPLVQESEPGSGEVCDLLEAIGGTCEACADGDERCVGVHVRKAQLWPAENPPVGDLPLCGIDALGEVPTLSCDAPDISFECTDPVGCNYAGRVYGSFAVFLMPWLVRRRRSER